MAMLRGAKRYVLLPPNECENLYMYPRGHPEGREGATRARAGTIRGLSLRVESA